MNKTINTLAALAAAFLIFLAGSASSFFDSFPGRLFHDAFRGAEALFIQQTSYKDPFSTNLWHPKSHNFSGIGRFNPDHSQTGYTLYTSGNFQGAKLIDMTGKVIHQWELPFYEAWPNPQHLDFRPDNEFIAWRKASLLPNGEIIALYIAEGITPWGMGVVKLDKDSNLIWQYSGKAHHDIDIDDNGNIYLLTHELIKEAYTGLARIKPPYLDDRVVVLDNLGNQILDIGILDSFVDSPYASFLLNIPRSSNGDYLHANAIDVVSPDLADNHPYAKTGDILVSMRQPAIIALIDPESKKVRWARRGSWIGQHDPDFLPNGNMLIFDNRGRMLSGGFSRVQEFNPLTSELVWEYHGKAVDPFFSGLRSSQQRLPNGNTLITESDRARLLEVTVNNTVVWEYVNPESGGPDNNFRPVLMWGQRYLEKDLKFLN
ncbi:MAG: arylsulfotransferase family protein [Pseudomonadota bacterium]|nr:arylsulfotransferase family protein [Pseudomonadota bacterium]